MGLMILPGPLLRERTTIRLGGRAQAEIVARSEEDLAETPSAVRRLTGATRTAAGLFVAIPSVTMYNLLLRRTKVLIIQWELLNGREGSQLH